MDGVGSDKASQTVDDAELVRKIETFFAGVGANFTCPVCTNNQWEVIKSAQASTALLLTDGSSVSQHPLPHIPLLTLMCDRCGFLRSHMQRKVLGT